MKTWKFEPLDIVTHNLAKTQPNQIAIQSIDASMTYSQLEARSNGIANFLANYIQGQQKKIILFGESSPDFITSIIAILKSGHIFIPIDSYLPIHRVKLLLEETKPDAILTNNIQYKNLISIMEEISNRQTIFLIDNVDQHESCHGYQYQYILDNEKLNFERKCEKNAYIFFTSGSTGKPKGVMGRHRSLAHFINWEVNQFNIDNTFKVSQLTNVSFDPFLRDIFVPLTVGGTSYLIPREIRMNAGALIDYIDKNKITLIHMVPTLFKSMLASAKEKSAKQEKILDSLKYILLAGELLHGADLKDFYELFGERIQLVNLYGPTETTLAKFYYMIGSNDASKSIIPIGRPITGAEGLILDEQCRICEPGEKGILYIRTPYISSGYFNNTQATKAAFIRNPYNNNINDLIYNTGDIARMLPDGNVELLGRVDFQVKIRGNRIELGEIESQLLCYPGIKEVVVTARKDKNNDQYLCAYYISDIEIAGQVLRENIGKTLPEYMVPTYYMRQEKLPLNSNGKIDRINLPEPTLTMDRIIVPPKNIIEKKLLAIWSDVLNLDVSNISCDDNFFELGGHSLKAIQVICRINSEVQDSISIQQFFLNPEVSLLSELIVTNQHTSIPDIKINNYEKNFLYPLSLSQRGIYIIQKMLPQLPHYNISHAYLLHGELNICAFEYSIKNLIERHEMLRTQIVEIKGVPFQKLIDDNFIFNYIECAQRAEKIPSSGRLTENHDDERLKELIDIHANYLFHLDHEPAARFQLIKVDSNSYLFQLTLHHIVVDAWSLDILVFDFWHLYQSNCHAIDKVLPQLDIKYTDYSIWSNSEEAAKYQELQQQYWLKQLLDHSSKLELPTDFSRPSEPSYAGKNIEIQIDADLLHSLEHISQQRGVTLFMTLLSVFNVLLYKYTGVQDIIVGTPVAGRSLKSLESVVGTFVNLLPLRNKLIATQKFIDLIETVRQTTIGAYQNQDYPYEYIIRDLNAPREVSRQGLFDIVFSMQNTRNEQLLSDIQHNVCGLDIRKYPVVNNYSKFDLTVTLTPSVSGMNVNFNYATDLFHNNRIKQMSQHFIHLLKQIASNPSQTIAEMQILHPDQLRTLIEDQNHVGVDFPKNKTIHAIFEDIVKTYPDNIAVVSSEGTLTYSQLNDRANKLACFILTKISNKDGIVAVLLNRSPKQIIALLAILKTGRAYLPLDADHPSDRLKWIIQDSNAQLLISHNELNGKIDCSLPTIYMDLCDNENLSSDNPNIACTSNDLAYVIYTSGTTGQPKGVLIEHQNVIQLFFHQPSYFSFSQNDTWTMFHSYCFDFSVWEMYGALLHGGKLILITSIQAKDPSLFLKVIKNHNVTILNQTPTAFYNIVEEEMKNIDTDLALRYVIFGGEALLPGKLKLWRKKYPNIALINMFGITETTVHVTFKEITEIEIENNISNIGKPLPSYKCYIVDRDQNLLPAGVPGELWIAGHGVARGYLNRSELTQTRFIDNPFCDDERVYKSGDLVKYLQNGEIQYLGRIDHQVQLHGFRIELGEIEQVLLTHPDVLDVRVFLKESSRLGMYICAYVICTSDVALNELKRYSSKKLPYYMVPSFVIKVDRFPTTINGKVDAKMLPEPISVINTEIENIAPRNSIEQILKESWQQALGMIGISVKDNFFYLGGDSLRALTAVAISKRQFTLADLFKYPVLEDLAEHIQSSSNCNYLSPLSKTHKPMNSVALIAIPYGGGDAADFQHLAKDVEKINSNISVFGVELPGYDFSRGPQEFHSITKLAENIIIQIKQEGYDSIILYGHCVGSALAIALAQEVEKQSINLLAVFVAAVYPPRWDPKEEPILDPWKNVSDQDIVQSLRTLGWSNTELNADIMHTVLKNFRHDVREFRKFFYEFKDKLKLKSSLCFLVGSLDRSTEDHAIRAEEWSVFAMQLKTIIIENGDHYFVKSMSETVAKIICNEVEQQVGTNFKLKERTI